ncbi:hypothetical protein MPNT_160042 [Candidatus Methylacidithermus pantelleriae]|uniref:Uncharacterized protein n=1 Tax=Candidatus Methylacidithermus pantelleriae TaxID=2744239 RepID=A0A8J2BKT8_9BACT|nr:hypothetical protein MPNT_160042 [Candidatus Methylacidithermus pantelleriae]
MYTYASKRGEWTYPMSEEAFGERSQETLMRKEQWRKRKGDESVVRLPEEGWVSSGLRGEVKRMRSGS